MNHFFILFLLLLLSLFFLPTESRLRTSLDFGWRFLQTEKQSCVDQIPDTFSPFTPTQQCTVPYCQPNYDDTSWRQLSVPHDFVIEGNFSSGCDRSHGYLPKGVAWYRLHFTVPQNLQGDNFWITFDGVYRDSTTYLNGQFLGSHPSGYTSFYYYISDVVEFGGDNVLAVRVDSTTNEGWWYEGGGIYRHVWLTQTDDIHIIPWGIYAPSGVTGSIYKKGNTFYGSSASLVAHTEVTNKEENPVVVQVLSRLFDTEFNLVAYGTTQSSVAPNQVVMLNQTLMWNDSVLWDIENPYMYSLQTTVEVGSIVRDRVDTNIGVRKVMFLPEDGLFLNDRHIKLRGFCNHQDFAGVGTAVPDRVNEFRVTKLKEMGFNGWRMSHNPPNPELLDFLDAHGILVWDENRNFGNTPQYQSDVASMVRRDRNHPSIFIWSLCNEVGCHENANDSVALSTAKLLKSIIRDHDKSRPVSGAWNCFLPECTSGMENSLRWGWANPVMDVQGINYWYQVLDWFHKTFPKKPLIQSETASCTCARGIYQTNNTAAHKDVYSAAGCVHDWWENDATRPFVEGGFGWTGFDYKGEPSPYSWPDINSNFGTVDLAGFEKDTFYYYKSWWTNETTLHMFPHWNDPSSNATFAENCSSSEQVQHIRFTGSSSHPGQLVNFAGLCVDATCDNVDKGCTPLSLAPCDSTNDNQMFHHQTDHSFKNVKNGGCVDLWYSGKGPMVGVYKCDGAPNQKWIVNGTQIRSEASGDRCLSAGPFVRAWVYSNAHSVELKVNSRSQGKQMIPYLGHAEWILGWEAGTVQAIGYDEKGNVIGMVERRTTGAPAALKLSIDAGNDGIHANGQDVALVRATVVDSKGDMVPTASNFISFSVSGADGTIVGVGNGDPSCHEPDKGTTRSAFGGLARVIVGATKTEGTILVTAKADGLTSGTVSVRVVA